MNVASSVTLKAPPLLSISTASKAAVNSFSEGLALDPEPFNIRVRVVLPGRSPETRFGENARARMSGFPAPSSDLEQRVFADWQTDASPVPQAKDVSEATWRAVTDPASPSRIPVGADALALSPA